jgi:hypothetical protein
MGNVERKSKMTYFEDLEGIGNGVYIPYEHNIGLFSNARTHTRSEVALNILSHARVVEFPL